MLCRRRRWEARKGGQPAEAAAAAAPFPPIIAALAAAAVAEPAAMVVEPDTRARGRAEKQKLSPAAFLSPAAPSAAAEGPASMPPPPLPLMKADVAAVDEGKRPTERRALLEDAKALAHHGTRASKVAADTNVRAASRVRPDRAESVED